MLPNEGNNLSAIIKTVKTSEGKVARIEREIIESDGIAFDHAKIIEYGIERLRKKLLDPTDYITVDNYFRYKTLDYVNAFTNENTRKHVLHENLVVSHSGKRA